MAGELIAEMRSLDLRVEPTHTPWRLQPNHGVQAAIDLGDARDFGVRIPHEGEPPEVRQVRLQLIRGQHRVRYYVMSATNGQAYFPDTCQPTVASAHVV